MQKYLFLFLIPVFFGLTSCAHKPSQRPEGFFDFTSQIEPKQAPAPTPEKEKPATEVKEEKKKAEPAEETKEVKAEEKPAPAPVAPPVTSKKDKIHASKRFNLGYLTFDVADFYGEIIPLDSNGDYTRYQFRFYSRTNGFVDYLFGWISHTISITKVYDNKVVPEKFRTKVVLKGKVREISLDYNSSGSRLTHEEVIPPDNRGKRPAVGDDMKVNTYDPLSAVLEARRLVMDAFKKDNFNDRKKYSFDIPLYDGRRRSDLKFELDKEKVNGLYHLKAIQHPIAGYTKNEWDDLKKGARTVDLYLDPTSFWPVSALGESGLGKAKAHYVQECSMAFEDCIKLSDDKRKK